MGLVRYADDGFFVPRKIAEAFRTTSEEVARTAGLGKDAELCQALTGQGLSCAAGQKLRARCNRERPQSRTLGLG